MTAVLEPKLRVFQVIESENEKFILCTVDGSEPNETVYYLHKREDPSWQKQDFISESIEAGDFEELNADEFKFADFAIKAQDFEEAGEVYAKIYRKLKNAGY